MHACVQGGVADVGRGRSRRGRAAGECVRARACVRVGKLVHTKHGARKRVRRREHKEQTSLRMHVPGGRLLVATERVSRQRECAWMHSASAYEGAH